MGSTIFVVLGAGASRGCLTEASAAVSRQFGWRTKIGDWTPPLVTDLFDHRWGKVLGNYPMVENAAAEIREATRDSPALEEYLRKTFRDSDDEDDQRTYAAIPPYLQEVLLGVSRHYANHADNYALLTQHLLRHFRRVIYVTMNYDLLLDRTLYARQPLLSLDDYVAADRWALIKPHGSVTWGREVLVNNFNFRDPPSDFELDGPIKHFWTADFELAPLRHRNDEHERWFYPALSVPLGVGEKSFNCPDAHLDYLTEALEKVDAVDMLCLGYSANDRELLDLFASVDKEIASVLVANQGEDDSLDALTKLSKRLGFGLTAAHNVYKGQGFSEFLRSDHFKRWTAEVAGDRRPRKYANWNSPPGVTIA